ncbi:MAG: hypothetical protein K6G84_11125 [Lachnospiraceae bacterium]|nr:hypothetical protein [Lachnospiraceae bacterium]
MKGKRLFAVVFCLIWLVAMLLMIRSRTKLTYIECKYENEVSSNYIEIKDNSTCMEQHFFAPYDIIHGIAIKIGTFQRDNNSIWKISIIKGEYNEIVYSKDYNASLLVDNEFHLFKFDKRIRVSKGEDYIIRISPVKVNEDTSLAFYSGENQEYSYLKLNGVERNDVLCFSVYGGDVDNWWLFYNLFLAIMISIVTARGYIILLKKQKLMSDIVFGGMITACIVLLLLNSFAVSGTFTDEWDNIRGGMVIAKGGVLYRDYVTQHTPVMYYLCGIFAMLGAGSLQQFRLSYYFFEAVIWGLLYVRHAKNIGKKKMIILASLECIFVSSVLGASQGYMILSDGMQGICMVALLLEFLGYYRDNEIDWKRSIIISLSVWGSFGSAFISAYAILFVVIIFLILEIVYISKVKIKPIDLIKRYYRLLLSMIIPFIAATLYFKLNHSLKRAFEQFYLFNREVYSKYTSIGDNLFEPFITSAQNFFGIIADKFNAIIVSTATNADILQFAIATVATTVIVTMCIKKKYIESLPLFLVMIFSASRGYGFHGIAAWYVAIMIISLYGEDILQSCIKKIAIPSTILIGIFLLSLYARSVGTNLLYEQQPVSEIESRVIGLTDENEDILIDVYCNDTIYYCYKNRYPANRACYMLAWYMDWYEQDTIDDLNLKNPRVVIYNPDQEVWSYKYYTDSFCKELKKNYSQISDNPDDGWKYRVWKRNS